MQVGSLSVCLNVCDVCMYVCMYDVSKNTFVMYNMHVCLTVCMYVCMYVGR